MTSKLVDSELPLLLAGTDDEVSEYRSVSSHKHILPAHVNGNYAEAYDHVIHELAWPLVQTECHERDHNELVQSFHEFQGAGKSSEDMADIEEAVKRGRVEALLLGLITSTRDTISDASRPITKIILSREMAADINSLAIATHRQGGRIIALMDQVMPAKTAMAAIYRY